MFLVNNISSICQTFIINNCRVIDLWLIIPLIQIRNPSTWYHIQQLYSTIV